MPRPPDLILGRLGRPQGLGGEIRAELYAEAWGPYSLRRDLILLGPDGTRQRRQVERSRPVGRRAVLLKFRGVESSQAARALAGWEVAVPRPEAAPLPAGTYYHYDILGLEVVDEAGASLGRIAAILPTPAHDVYLVRGRRGEWLLPATQEHVRAVDLGAGQMRVAPMEGLVDADAV